MKKNVYAVFCVVLFLLGPCSLRAEKLSLNKAFDKLVANCTDFKSLYASGEPSGFEYPTKVEVDKTQRCFIKKVGANVAFVAEYGTFDTQKKADEFVKSLETMFKNAKPSFRFTSGFSEKNRAVTDYFFEYKPTAFNRYDACFKQVRIGTIYQVVFEFPQTGINETVFLTFAPITVKSDDADFSRSFKGLLEEAMVGFASIKGESTDGRDLQEFYVPKLKPTGYSECFLEEVGNDVYRYVMEVCYGVSKSKLEANLDEMLKKLYPAFGSDYAVAYKGAQKKYIFVNKEDPSRDVAVLETKQSRQDYSLTLYIYPFE